MGEKDDDGFGLSLSLGGSSSFANNNNNNNNNNNKQKQPLQYFPLNLMQTSHMSMMNLNQKLPFSPAAFQDLNVRGIDVNLSATMADEDVLVSSPNSTVSSVSGKRSEREENEAAERDSSYEEEDGGDAAARKKLRLSKEQAAMLEETFKEHNTLNPKQKVALAKELNLRPRQVEVWFQNRRARTKLKQTEVDCEYLKRCCENLTEENKRLQKEVTELRTLKLSPQFYMNMSPPTTLTMCPQCQRVAVSSTSSSSASASSSLPTAGAHNRRQHNNPVAPCQPHQSTPVNPSWAALFPRE